MSIAALLVVGNEILDGSTTDTNSGWICRQLAGRGANVLGIMVVPDDALRIVAALEHLGKLRPDLIVTLGGLGPTRDDLTVSAIAQFLSVPVVMHSKAMEIVDRRYRELAEEGRVGDPKGDAAIEARRKMAMMPEAAVALDNTVGAAPGMFVMASNMGLLALPGVPSELKDIFTNQAGPHLEKTIGTGYFKNFMIITSTNDESSLAGVLSRFDDQFGHLKVYVKSRAKRFGGDVRMQVTLSAVGTSREEVSQRTRSAVEEFSAILASADIDVFDTVEDA